MHYSSLRSDAPRMTTKIRENTKILAKECKDTDQIEDGTPFQEEHEIGNIRKEGIEDVFEIQTIDDSYQTYTKTIFVHRKRKWRKTKKKKICTIIVNKNTGKCTTHSATGKKIREDKLEEEQERNNGSKTIKRKEGLLFSIITIKNHHRNRRYWEITTKFLLGEVFLGSSSGKHKKNHSRIKWTRQIVSQ